MQALAAFNRQKLADAGLLFPKSPGPRSQVGLVLFAMGDKSPAAFRRVITQSRNDPAAVEAYRDTLMERLGAEFESSSCPRMLLSCELLSSRLLQPEEPVDLIEQLRTLAPNVKVLIYLRPQYELITSAYSTSVVCGATHRLNTEIPPDHSLFDYDRMLARWEAAVGRDNMIVRRFGRGVFKRGALVEDFFDALGMPVPEGVTVPADRATALDAPSLEFLRIANGILNDEPEAVDLKRRLATTMEKHRRRIEAAAPFRISGADLTRIDETFAESNRRVAERYFPELGGKLFQPPKSPDQPASPPISIEDAVRVGLALWRAASARKAGRPADAAKPRRLKRAAAADDGAASPDGLPPGRARRAARRRRRLSTP